MTDNDFGHLLLRVLGQNRKVSRISAQIMAEVCQDWEDKHVEALFMLKTCSYNLGNPENLYVSDLTREMHDTPQSVSRLLRMLEQEGLIERHSDPEDRRKTYILFTETGEKAVLQCWERLTGIEEDIEHAMGIEQLSKLCDDYQKLILAMENITEQFKNPDKLRLPPMPPEQAGIKNSRSPLIVEVTDGFGKEKMVSEGNKRRYADVEFESDQMSLPVPENPAEKKGQDSKEDRKNKKRKKSEKTKKEKQEKHKKSEKQK